MLNSETMKRYIYFCKFTCQNYYKKYLDEVATTCDWFLAYNITKVSKNRRIILTIYPQKLSLLIIGNNKTIIVSDLK